MISLAQFHLELGKTYEAVITFKLNTEIQCLIFDAILSFDK